MNKTVSERASSGRPRFPFPRYPTGWFQIGWTEDVAVGQVVPMTRFGKELVVFRRSDGVIKVLDAYCPHLGAHHLCDAAHGRVHGRVHRGPQPPRVDHQGRSHHQPHRARQGAARGGRGEGQEREQGRERGAGEEEQGEVKGGSV